MIDISPTLNERAFAVIKFSEDYEKRIREADDRRNSEEDEGDEPDFISAERTKAYRGKSNEVYQQYYY